MTDMDILIKELEKVRETLCNGDCNKCGILRDPNFKKVYLIFALFEALCDEGYEIVQTLCPNFTCCPIGHIDDFTHFEGCEIGELIERLVEHVS